MIFKLVLTGGPCGGKTSAVPIIKKVFETNGWHVLTIGEVARIIFSGGIHFDFEDLVTDYYKNIQLRLVGQLKDFEDTFFDYAEWKEEQNSQLNVLVICDRGMLDPLAFVQEEYREKMLKSIGLSLPDILNRYDLVAHLVTAADGALSCYTLKNNSARTTTPEQAIKIDRNNKTGLWSQHKNFIIIDNSDVRNFGAKVDKLLAPLCTKCGIPYTSQSYYSKLPQEFTKFIKKIIFLLPVFASGVISGVLLQRYFC